MGADCRLFDIQGLRSSPSVMWPLEISKKKSAHVVAVHAVDAEEPIFKKEVPLWSPKKAPPPQSQSTTGLSNTTAGPDTWRSMSAKGRPPPERRGSGTQTSAANEARGGSAEARPGQCSMQRALLLPRKIKDGWLKYSVTRK